MWRAPMKSISIILRQLPMLLPTAATCASARTPGPSAIFAPSARHLRRIGDVAGLARDGVALVSQPLDHLAEPLCVDIDHHQRMPPPQRAGDRTAQPAAADDQRNRGICQKSGDIAHFTLP